MTRLVPHHPFPQGPLVKIKSRQFFRLFQKSERSLKSPFLVMPFEGSVPLLPAAELLFFEYRVKNAPMDGSPGLITLTERKCSVTSKITRIYEAMTTFENSPTVSAKTSAGWESALLISSARPRPHHSSVEGGEASTGIWLFIGSSTKALEP